MIFLKFVLMILVFLASNLIGRIIAGKYRYRYFELQEIRTALSMFKTKIKFTYEPIPQIFDEIEKNLNTNISRLFKSAKNEMNEKNAGQAWEYAVDNNKNYLNSDDKRLLKTMSKMLGQSDAESQISQIEMTEEFIEKQIKEAELEKNKNEKLLKKLGTVLGLAIVIILA